jgi:hypothetical protein
LGELVDTARRASRKLAPVIEPAMHGADRLRALAGPRRSPVPLPSRPGWCIAAVSHWQAAGREGYLVDTIKALLCQAERTSVVVVTNEPDVVGEVLEAALADVVPVHRFPNFDGAAAALVDGDPGVLVARWPGTGREHSFRLTWGHKALFRELVREQRAFERGLDHLVYIEDDLALAPDALAYWTDYRPLLAPLGLIPGFTRVEGPDDDARLTSPYRAVPLSELPQFVLPSAGGREPDLTFVNLLQPYQGFYVLDAPLALAHFGRSSFRAERRSALSTSLGGGWGLRERAAAGAMFDDLPRGVRSRNVIPLRAADDGYLVPLDVCLVRHLPSNYYADASTKKATVPVHAAFLPT